MLKYSLTKQLKNDFATGILLIIPLVSWGLYFFHLKGFLSYKNTGGAIAPVSTSGSQIFLHLGIVLSTIILILLVLRVLLFMKLCKEGVVAEAKITHLSFFRDRGRIEFSYSLHGNDFSSANGIFKNKYTSTLREGDLIKVVFHPDSQKKKGSFLELFAREVY